MPKLPIELQANSRFSRTSILLLVATLFSMSPMLVATLHAQDSKQLKLQEQRGIEEELRWQVSLDDRKTWKDISVPGTIENQIQIDFDGVSWYRTEHSPVKILSGHRLLLKFGAVATEATVFVNGKEIGKHLGGWTPFEFDITQEVRESEKPIQIEVRCDELVGHNTQGFLPVFAPHFSGMWKPVKLEWVPEVRINRNRSFVWGDLENKKLRFEIHIDGWKKGDNVELRVSSPYQINPFASDEENKSRQKKYENDPANWKTWKVDSEIMRIDWEKQYPKAWNTRTAHRNEYKISLIHHQDKGTQSRSDWIVSTAFRSMKVDGDKVILNGKPVQIRGVLNWGYAPPGVAPSLDEEFMLKEIQFAKARGFNMMKFCLWIPPKKYLELCDEMGMLAWIEYPTWHPKLTPEHLANLKKEYEEFFYYVRQHPSVILHSLTCETGPSADIEVIRELYDLCKKRVPGAIVEDDSSWIAWNRVHDFYDDHPYGNNHDWVSTLDRLKKYISERELKPLILGEAIAADTWTDPSPILQRTDGKDTHWTPGFLMANAEFVNKHFPDEATRAAKLAQFQNDSHRYAMLMRKYQIETYRREVPNGGYVISVIRDVPLCGMGLIDYAGKEKTTPEQWNWHRDLMILQANGGRRSYFADEKANFKIVVSNHSPSETLSSLALLSPANSATSSFKFPETKIEVGKNHEFETEMRFPALSGPKRFKTRVALGPDQDFLDVDKMEFRSRPTAENEWDLWAFPRIPFYPNWTEITSELQRTPVFGNVYLHKSIKQQFESEFSGESHELSATILDWNAKQLVKPQDRIITHVLDSQLLDALANGAQVILLANGQSKSFRTSDHWFLRGGPVINRELIQHFCPADAAVDLQHFDLAGPVIPQIQNETTIEPILSLWDNHDLKETRLHGLLFRMPVGKGNLMVSALNHFGKQNAAGNYMLKMIVNQDYHVARFASRQGAKENLERLQKEMVAAEIDLSTTSWKFKPDPDELGIKGNWYASEFETNDWTDIRITNHWEGQGHKALDHWAWYRKTVTIPKDWKSETTYLNFTGVDDHYRVYVNGQFVGKDGVIETRQTAFENRKSWDISKLVQPGEKVVIAVAVYDWYGAGGIFRPVTLTTSPLSQKRPWLAR